MGEGVKVNFMYWKYFLYILEHKKNVGIECFKMGMPIHAITHDLSKFLPSEFIGYAKYFYGNKEKYKKDFDSAWLLHQHRNKHHWDYWVKSDTHPVSMPKKYVKQMIADWRGMGRKFNDTAESFYNKNKDRFIMHIETEFCINELINRD